VENLQRINAPTTRSRNARRRANRRTYQQNQERINQNPNWNLRPDWEPEHLEITHCLDCHQAHEATNPWACHKFPGLNQDTCVHCHQDWNLIPTQVNPWLSLVDNKFLLSLNPAINYTRSTINEFDFQPYWVKKLVDLVFIFIILCIVRLI